MLGLRLRSIAYLKVWAVTGSLEGGEKRKPFRIVNVYVLPSVGPCRQRLGDLGLELGAGRAGLVRVVEELRAGGVRGAATNREYASAGSMESTSSPWTEPHDAARACAQLGSRSACWSTVTQTRPPATTTPCGLPPTSIVS